MWGVWVAGGSAQRCWGSPPERKFFVEKELLKLTRVGEGAQL
eukprot:COSAG02_NODE_7346_length_3053_cov_7.426713_3_plen_42_part_00